MINDARRTSMTPGGTRPPSPNTLTTSGRLRKRATISSVVFSVKASWVPGGSSMASSDRAESCAGKKPCGSKVMLQIDAAKMPHLPGHQPVIGLQHASGRRIFMMAVLHEIGGQHRRDEARGQQREKYLHR